VPSGRRRAWTGADRADNSRAGAASGTHELMNGKSPPRVAAYAEPLPALSAPLFPANRPTVQPSFVPPDESTAVADPNAEVLRGAVSDSQDLVPGRVRPRRRPHLRRGRSRQRCPSAASLVPFCGRVIARAGLLVVGA